MRRISGFTLMEILIALGVFLLLLTVTVAFQQLLVHQMRNVALKQNTLTHMQNTLERLRALPYAQIQTSAPEGVVVNEIKPGLKEILVVSGNLKLYTRRADHP